MRTLICGGRDYTNKKYLYSFLANLDRIKKITAVIQGGARGADYLARLWALEFNKKLIEYKADWDRYGNIAGPIRNVRMLEEGRPNFIVAFPGGRGTAHMMKIARFAGVEVIEA